MSERLTDVAVRPTAEHYALPTPQEVEDQITEQRSIVVSAHVQSWAYLGQPRGQAKPGVGKAIST
jgi:hypothetical protein